MIFLPAGRKSPALALAAPLLAGLLAVAAAGSALWGLVQAGRAVPVKLPAVEPGAPMAGTLTGGHVIVILGDGSYQLGGARLPRAELLRRLEQLGRLPGQQSEEILIRADAAAPFARVAELLEACRRVGLVSVRFEVAGGEKR